VQGEEERLVANAARRRQGLHHDRQEFRVMVLACRCDCPISLEPPHSRDFSAWPGRRRAPRSESPLRLARTLTAALRAHDPETARHTRRVTRLSLRLGAALGLDPADLFTLRLGALLHDVGKLCVCRSILSKPAALAAEEMEVVRRHPELGAELVACFGPLRRALPIVRSHHERFDGGGYPDGLGGEAIPRLARLVAITDAFDAITSDRPYRPGATAAEALDVLARNSGSHFDPRLVEAFGLVMLESRLQPFLCPPKTA
jgi:putative nucleotidyltransferase with HDIG domain